MKIFKNINFASDVEGFLTNREGCLLYSLAYACQNRGSIVEIGSFKGKSTIWLANGIKNKNSSTKVYTIDPYAGVLRSNDQDIPGGTFGDFKNNIKKANIENFIVPIVKTSKDARKNFNQPIELLFIDGLHEFEYVNEDYHLWTDLIVTDGYIAFHDTSLNDVSRVIDKVFNQDSYRVVYFTDTLVAGQKVKFITLKDKLKNKAMLYLNRQFHKAWTSRSPKIVRKIWKDLIKFSRDLLFLF